MGACSSRVQGEFKVNEDIQGKDTASFEFLSELEYSKNDLQLLYSEFCIICKKDTKSHAKNGKNIDSIEMGQLFQ